jgi:small subunit ribosomal protein S21
MPEESTRLALALMILYERVETFGRTIMPTDAIQCKPLEVAVADRGIERAIKQLKRKMATEGIMKELKRRRQYMKPSVKRRKKAAEAARRRRKRARMEAGLITAAPPRAPGGPGGGGGGGGRD